ncbi:MAG: hypothetical protein JWR16_3216 [Nevskia sp.]|nr:hypothetical protein [Nevskia sp.]
MAHFSYLYSSDRPEPYEGTEGREEQLYLSARYRLPIFWIAAFEKSDLRFIQVGQKQWPYTVAERQCVVERLQVRRESIQAVLPHLWHLTFDQFVDVLSKNQQHFIHMNLTDIGLMLDEPDDLEIRVKVMLTAFEKPPFCWSRGPRILFRLRDYNPGLKRLFAFNGISPGKPNTLDINSLAGGWFGDMPWEPVTISKSRAG